MRCRMRMGDAGRCRELLCGMKEDRYTTEGRCAYECRRLEGTLRMKRREC